MLVEKQLELPTAQRNGFQTKKTVLRIPNPKEHGMLLLVLLVHRHTVVRHSVEWSHKLPLLQAEWHPGESALSFVENVIAREKARLEEYDASKRAYEAAVVINYQKIRDLTLSAIRDAASG